MSAVFTQLCLVTFLARVSYQMARSPVLPRLAEDLGAAPALIGLIVGASTLTGVVWKFPSGVLSERVGRHRMLLIGSAFFAFPPFVYPFIQAPGALLAIRFLHGFATALFMPVASALVVDLFRAAKAERLGWFSFAGEFGATLGPVIGGWLLFRTQGYAAPYLVAGGLGVAAFALMVRLHARDGTPTRSAASPAELWRMALAILRRRAVLVTSMVEACLFLGIGAFIGFTPIFAKSHGINEAQVGLILCAQLLTSMAWKPLTGRRSDRMGRKPMIQLGLALAILVLPWAGVATSFWGLLAVSAALGLARAIVTPSTTALVAEHAQDIGHGSAMGIFGTIYDIGDAGGPILAGLLIGSLGYGPCYAAIAGLMAFGLVVFSCLVPDRR